MTLAHSSSSGPGTDVMQIANVRVILDQKTILTTAYEDGEIVRTWKCSTSSLSL